jgi:poly(3-hydroxybutyrate) depolymerase
MGHSNGGGFCYALWRFRSDAFAGFAPTAAKGSRYAGPAKPFYIVASRNDTIVPYAEQEASFKDLIARMKMEEKGKQGSITKYANPDGVRMEIYIDGGTHAFAKESVPGMVAFFRSLI